MKRKILDSGEYEVYENEYQRRILIFDSLRYYAWNKGSMGWELFFLEPMDYIPTNYMIKMKGKYYIMDLVNDSQAPYLYLQDNNVFMEAVLPDGMPTNLDPGKRIQVSDRTVPKDWVENSEKSWKPAKGAE